MELEGEDGGDPPGFGRGGVVPLSKGRSHVDVHPFNWPPFHSVDFLFRFRIKGVQNKTHSCKVFNLIFDYAKNANDGLIMTNNSAAANALSAT